MPGEVSRSYSGPVDKPAGPPKWALLTNAELDAAVGTEVMGYSLATWEEFESENLDTSRSYLVSDGHRFRLFTFDAGDGYAWSPSSNITNAFSVQEKIKELGLQNDFAHCLQEITAKEAQQSTCTYWWFLISATPKQRSLAALEAVRKSK